jgi:hypothetical protein
VTVSIYFKTTNQGLADSIGTFYDVSYFDYYNALKANATSAAQKTALASLGPAPTSSSSGNPVNGNTQIQVTSSQSRALGFGLSGGQGPGGKYDGVIEVNTSLTSPPNALNGNTYGLKSTVAHEMDQILGIGGAGTTLTGTGSLTGDVGGLDLFRYSASGVRSYSNNSAAPPYFSIDGGKTVLSYFNQTLGADFADWKSDPIPAGFQPQVQDAFGTPGTDPALGPNELTALSAVGWNVSAASVPEPSSLTLVGQATLVLVGVGAGWRLRRRPGRLAA